MDEIIKIYLENISTKAKRLGLSRRTLYAWKENPPQANLLKIEKDVRGLLELIEKEKTKSKCSEYSSTQHPRN